MGDALKSFLYRAQHHTQMFSAHYYSFTCFAVIYYGMPFQFWSDVTPEQAAENIILRTTASTLSFFLIFKDSCSAKIKHYFPLYWYFVLIFCLPFASTYMMISNMVSFPWFFISIFLLSILVNWISFIAITAIGCFSAIVVVGAQGKLSLLKLSDQTFAAYACVFTVLIVCLFLRKRDQMVQEQLKAYKVLAAYIAHEMRKPLGFLKMSAEGIEKNFAQLFEGYAAAVKTGVYKDEINPLAFNALKRVPSEFKKAASDGLLFIDMLLVQTRTSWEADAHIEQGDAMTSINNALQRWRLGTDRIAKINCQDEQSFRYLGSPILIDHILLELLRNSEYFIGDKKDAQIDIWCQKSQMNNEIHFKDNGYGIDAEDLKHVFKTGFSKRRYGTGIGLGFCRAVMKQMGGSIKVHSQKNCYTEVVLSFPAIQGEEKYVAQSYGIPNNSCAG